MALKDGNHDALIEAVNNLYDQAEVHHHEIIDEETKATHQFRFANNVPLNLQDQTEMVNVLDYIEFGKDGHILILRYWSWITDIELTNETVKDVMIGGRTRWSIENESFNNLKTKVITVSIITVMPKKSGDEFCLLRILINLNTHSVSFEHPELLTHCPV